MKKILAVVLLVSGIALADDIQTSTTTSTNRNRIIIKEYVTRNGSTNLYRETNMQAGVMVGRVHQIIYEGQLAAGIIEMTNGLSIIVEPGGKCTVDTELRPDGKLDALSLMAQDGGFLDKFTATNGILYPVQTSELNDANKCWRDNIKPFMDLLSEKPKRK